MQIIIEWGKLSDTQKAGLICMAGAFVMGIFLGFMIAICFIP